MRLLRAKLCGLLHTLRGAYSAPGYFAPGAIRVSTLQVWTVSLRRVRRVAKWLRKAGNILQTLAANLKAIAAIQSDKQPDAVWVWFQGGHITPPGTNILQGPLLPDGAVIDRVQVTITERNLGDQVEAYVRLGLSESQDVSAAEIDRLEQILPWRNRANDPALTVRSPNLRYKWELRKTLTGSNKRLVCAIEANINQLYYAVGLRYTQPGREG